MRDAAGIVLAGGRSSRMGEAKAGLAWHGSTLLRRVTGLLTRCVEGPLVVVRAPGQPLPALPSTIEVVEDAREGRGPMQGLAAGLAAVGARSRVAFVASTDVPLLHPAFVRRVLSAFSPGIDVVLPRVGGYRQPLAAGYRVELGPVVKELVWADRLAPAVLFERVRVLVLDDDAMLADARLAAVDPGLASVSNLNDRDDYDRARAMAPPQIQVQAPGARPRWLRAWSLGGLAAAVGIGHAPAVVLNGAAVAFDPELPLVAGDVVRLGSQPRSGVW